MLFLTYLFAPSENSRTIVQVIVVLSELAVDICVSQGSVATHFRCGGIFVVHPLKDFENDPVLLSASTEVQRA